MLVEFIVIIILPKNLVVGLAIFGFILKQREPKWQEYHKSVHTMSSDLGKMCSISKPKLLITTHRIYHIDFYNDNLNIEKEIKEREEFILDEIRNHYNGNVINGHDLDVFDI